MRTAAARQRCRCLFPHPGGSCRLGSAPCWKGCWYPSWLVWIWPCLISLYNGDCWTCICGESVWGSWPIKAFAKCTSSTCVRVHKGRNSSIRRTLAAGKQRGSTVVSAIASHVLVRLAASVHVSRFALILATNGPAPVCCWQGMELRNCSWQGMGLSYYPQSSKKACSHSLSTARAPVTGRHWELSCFLCSLLHSWTPWRQHVSRGYRCMGK